MEIQKGYEIILNAVSMLRVDPTFGSRLSNKWLPAATWVEVLKNSGLIDRRFEFDTGKFNKAMTSEWGSCMERFDGSNITGVFRLEYSKKLYYHFTDKNKQVRYPHSFDAEWKDRILDAAKEVLGIKPGKRARPVADNTQPRFDEASVANNKIQRTEEKLHVTQQFQQMNYWNSPEAKKLFRSSEVDEGAEATLQRRVDRLKSVNERNDGWRNVIDGRDPDNLCTNTDIFEIRQRSALLCCAYQTAIEHMNDWKWHDCCKEACKYLNRVGLTQSINYLTVAQLNIAFRLLENFPHPNLQSTNKS